MTWRGLQMLAKASQPAVLTWVLFLPLQGLGFAVCSKVQLAGHTLPTNHPCHLKEAFQVCLNQ